MEREEIVAYLRGVPDRIEEALAGLSDDDLRRRPPAGESEAGWSALEVLCHLRDYAEEEGLRVRRLVQEDRPALAAWDQLERARERDYANDGPARVRTSLRAFWGGLAYQLEGLTDAQWQRPGTHPELGEVTVRSRAERQVAHARDHIEQLKALREGDGGEGA